jgi:hypothetical protein
MLTALATAVAATSTVAPLHWYCNVMSLERPTTATQLSPLHPEREPPSILTLNLKQKLTTKEFILFSVRLCSDSISYVRGQFWLISKYSQVSCWHCGQHSLLYKGCRVSFPAVKRPGRGINHPSPCRAEVKERVELHLYSTFGPSWPVTGRTSTFFIIIIIIIIIMSCLLLWDFKFIHQISKPMQYSV